MERIPEPQLMDDEEQARAYAAADFEEPHNRFIELFREAFPRLEVQGFVLDLGCGPGDITVRFARAFPGCRIHGIDGAASMLDCGREIIERAGDIHGRIELFQMMLPGPQTPRCRYNALISNSLLHHLADPQALWETVLGNSEPGAPVFIMDLMRPQTSAKAQKMVELYMPGEPEILRRDFYNSLRAAYTIDEVRGQLSDAGLGGLTIRQVSDRHLAVWGII